MYRLRFIVVMLKSLLSQKRELSDDFELNFWVVPFLDTDLKLLFTQTYSQYMGLARWNLLFNSEFRTAALKRGWVPVTTRETLSYKRSIKVFDRVRLLTRIIHWNERRFYLEHVFYVKGEIKALAYVEGLVRGPKGHLKPEEAFKAMGVTRESEPLPEHLQGWIDLVYEPHSVNGEK
ncbi:MAG: thioesterase family protein [Cyclobacteriaceae bacterium]